MVQEWEILGGGDKGGLLVREGSTLKAKTLTERLSTGAIVQELSVKGDRLKYKLLSGTGPPEGWVNIRFSGKELAVPRGSGSDATAPEKLEVAAEEEEKQEDTAIVEEDEGDRAPFMKAVADMTDEEFERLPKPYYTQNVPSIRKPQMAKLTETREPGDHYGIEFPHSMELIEEMGAEWLTKAFHTAGTLPLDNEVTKLKEVIGLSLDPTKGEALGGAGVKILLKVEYKRKQPGLHTSLFVKLPHPYHPSNERYKISCMWYCDEPEIMFNRVMAPSLPFKTPKCYFGDISRKNTNCILICECLDFAKDWRKGFESFKPYELFPMVDKNRDYNILECGRRHYPAQVKAHARLVAAYKSGRFGPQEKLIQLFTGWNPGLDAQLRGGWPPEALQNPNHELLANLDKGSEAGVTQVKGLTEIALNFSLYTCPQLFNSELTKKDNVLKILKEACHIAQYQFEINAFMQQSYDYFSLMHVNMQIDNAFFYFDAKGEVEAGLLDWGSFAHSHIIQGMVGNWCGAEAEVMEELDEKLINIFCDELAAQGGPTLDRETVWYMMRLCQGGSIMGQAANLAQLYSMHKKNADIWKDIKNRDDPRVEDIFLMRVFTSNWRNMCLLFLSKKRSPYAAFLKWLKANPCVPTRKPVDVSDTTLFTG